MTKEIKKPFRKFLGEYPEKPGKDTTKEQIELFKLNRHFADAHLHAYLKGWTRFPYKRDEHGNQKFYPVQQEYLNTEK